MSEEPDNLARSGETVQLLLGKNRRSIHGNLVDSPRAGDQLHLVEFMAELLFQFPLQTGGLRFIVSLAAIGDGNLHMFLLKFSGKRRMLNTAGTDKPYHIRTDLQTAETGSA